MHLNLLLQGVLSPVEGSRSQSLLGRKKSLRGGLFRSNPLLGPKTSLEAIAAQSPAHERVIAWVSVTCSLKGYLFQLQGIFYDLTRTLEI